MSYFKFCNKNPRTLYGIISYVKREKKDDQTLIYGFGIDSETAFEEMDFAKQIWHKTSGRQYKHFIFSFDSNIQLSQKQVISIGRQIGLYYAKEYQLLMTLHTNKKNLHFHYVLNTINIFTGKKFSMTKQDVYQYKQYINAILLQYQLNPINLYDTKKPTL